MFYTLTYRVKKAKVFFSLLPAAAFLGLALGLAATLSLRFFLSSHLESSRSEFSFTRPLDSGNSVGTPTGIDIHKIVTGALIRQSGTSAGLAFEGEPAGVSELRIPGVISGSPRFAMALIQKPGAREVRAYKIGQNVLGYRIAAIRRNYVLLAGADGLHRVYVGGVEKQKMAGEKETKQQKVVSRTRLKQLLKEPKNLPKGGPYLKNNKIRGLQLTYVQPGSPFYKLGVRSGDIIRRFQGQKLDSTEKMLSIYQNLVELERAELVIERSGKIISFSVIIKD